MPGAALARRAATLPGRCSTRQREAIIVCGRRRGAVSAPALPVPWAVSLAESGTLCAASVFCLVERSSVVSSASVLLGTPPISRTRLIGRASERAHARSLLLEEAVPLLTLTGPGGVGKTRLALAIAGDVADHFADGVVWVDLAPLSDPRLIPAAVTAALGIMPAIETPIGEV